MPKDKNVRTLSQSESLTRGSQTTEHSSQAYSSNQKLSFLRDILGILHSLSDEEWESLMRGLKYSLHPKESKLEFAAFFAKIEAGVLQAAVNSDLIAPPSDEHRRATAHPEETTPQVQGKRKFKAKHINHAESSGDRLPMDLINIFNVTNTAKQEATCRVSSEERAGSSTENASVSPLADKALSKRSPSAETSDNKISELRRPTTPDTAAVTGKIVIVVFDTMDGSCAESRTIERASNKTDFLQRAPLHRKDLKAKACKAVSLVLASITAVLSGRSCKSSRASTSEVEQDSMLKTMAQAETTNDSAVTAIVDTIVDYMDAFSTYIISCPSPEREAQDHFLDGTFYKECGICAAAIDMFHTIHPKVKEFFNMSRSLKARVKEALPKISALQQSGLEALCEHSSSKSPLKTSDLAVDEQLIHQGSDTQLDNLTLTCTNDIVGGIVNLYNEDVFKSTTSTSLDTSELSQVSPQEMHQVMQELEKLASVSTSSSEMSPAQPHKDTVLISSGSACVNEEAGLSHCPASQHIQKVFSVEFQDKATQFVSEVLTNTRGKLSVKTFKDFRTGSPSFSFTPSPQPSIPSPPSLQDKDTASCMVSVFLRWLKKFSSSDHITSADNFMEPPSKRSQISARRIYRNVHKKVFKFLISFQQLCLLESESSDQEDGDACSRNISDWKGPSPTFSICEKVHRYVHASFSSCSGEQSSLQFMDKKLFSVLEGSPSRKSAPLIFKAASTDHSTSLHSTAAYAGVSHFSRPPFSGDSSESNRVRDAASYTTQSPEKSDDRVVEISISEDGTISERAAETVEATRPVFSTGFTLTQLENLIAACEPANVCRTSSSSTTESSWKRNIVLRDSVRFCSALLFLLADESNKDSLETLMNRSPAQLPGKETTPVAFLAANDQDTRQSMAKSHFQDLNLVKSADHQHVMDEAVLHCVSKALVDKVIMVALHIYSSEATSSAVRKTPGIVSINSQENIPTRSSPSMVIHSSCLGTAPGDVRKKSRQIHFHLRKRFPFISFGLKRKSKNKVNPLRAPSDTHLPSSSSHSEREPESCTSSSKKPCKLSRMFSAVSKALCKAFKPKST